MTKEEQIAKLKKLGDEFIYALIDNPYECPIVIDNKVRSAPLMNVQITTGRAIIQGDFSQEEMRRHD